MRRLGVSFRAITAAITGLLVFAGLATVALAVADEGLRRAFDGARVDSETIPAVDQLSLVMLNHDRLSYLARLRPGSGFSAMAQEARRRALRQLDGLQVFVNGASEGALYRSTAAKVRSYFDRRKKLDSAAVPPNEPRAGSAPSLDEALAGLREYRAYNVAQVDGEVRWAHEWLVLSRVAQVGVLIVLLLVGGVLLWAMRSGLVEPLSNLVGTMNRFAAGELSARVQPSGATELQTIGRELNEMAERLESAGRGRLQLIASVAHDLRNPLTALRLATDREPRSPEMTTRVWKIVHGQVIRLERMVNDLLDAVRLDAGQLALTPVDVDLRPLLTAAVDLYRDQDEKHPIALSVPTQPVVAKCDPGRISQVLDNLLSNAIKYSPEGGEVRVVLETVDGRAQLKIADQGIGIAPEDRARVFVPFERGAEAERVAPGTGLGLWIARRLVRAHGGNLDFDSIRSLGTTFRVELPLAERRTATTVTPPKIDATRAGDSSPVGA